MIYKIILDTFRVYWIAFKRFYREQYTYHASALSFTLLLALVPLLSVIGTLMTLFPGFREYMVLAQAYIAANFLPSVSNTIELNLENFIHQATSLSFVGISFLFVTTGTSIITIDNTLNKIWRIPDEKREYISSFSSWIVLILSPILIGASIFIGTYIFSLAWVNNVTSLIDKPLLTFVPIIINSCIFSAIYIFIPQVSVNWRDGFAGGFIAAVLFEITKAGFVFYFKIFNTYEFIYGVFAAIPIFLIWIYIIWVIILYGALVAYEYSLRSVLN